METILNAILFPTIGLLTILFLIILYGDLDITDFIAYFAIIALMFGLSWISRWKMAKSLRRAEASEKALEQERDLLEKHVIERTA